MSDVVVIGGIFRELIPAPDGPPIRRVGGSGYVAALTAAALGADVAIVSFVGDADSRATLSTLRRAGVDTDAVQVRPGASGVFAFEDVVDRRPPRPSYRPAESLPSSDGAVTLPSAPVVLAFGFPDFDCLEWLRAAVRPEGVLLWDRQGWLSRDLAPLALEELPAARRIYLANLQEMLEVTNRPTFAEGLEEQPAAGFDTSVIKCGRWGTIIVGGSSETTLVPAFLAPVNSVIGSGDAFAGALAAALARGNDLPGAALTGAASASLFVERRDNVLPSGLDRAVDQVIAGRSRRFVNPVGLERTRLYLAGPWFTSGEAMVISELEASLENLGVTVISPRRDIGQLSADSSAQEILAVGERDYAAIESSDMLVAVLDGDDPGTLMEVGFAARAGIPIAALVSHPDAVAQPMRAAAGVRVARSIPALLDEVTAWARETRGIG